MTAADDPGTVEVTATSPVRHLLIAFRQLPTDPGCSPGYPFRGSIGEVQFS